MDKRITQDAEYLICVLYDAYRLRRKNGELAEDAKMFGGSENIQEKYIPEWPQTILTKPLVNSSAKN